jgi:hypothetical protein
MKADLDGTGFHDPDAEKSSMAQPESEAITLQKKEPEIDPVLESLFLNSIAMEAELRPDIEGP